MASSPTTWIALVVPTRDRYQLGWAVYGAKFAPQLVPAGLQAFVVKGLPDVRSAAAPHDAPGTRQPAPSLLARLADLWRTIPE